MRRLTRLLTSVAAIAMAVGLTGCGSTDEAATKASPLSGVTLTLGDTNFLEPLTDASGMLKETPYKIKWAQFQAAPPMFSALQAGRIDTTYGGDSAALQALGSGGSLKLVASLAANGSGVSIVSQKNSSVRSIRDLKGKTVAVSPAKGSLADYLLYRSLMEAGMSPDDIKIKYLLPAAGQSAFSSGKIEVWATFGLYPAMAERNGAHIVVDGRDGRTSGLTLITASPKALNDPQKRAAIIDVTARISRAITWSHTHADEFAKEFASLGGVQIPIAKLLISQAPQSLLPLDTNVVSKIQTVADTMYEAKWLSRKITAASAVDRSIVESKSGGSGTQTSASPTGT